MSLAQNKNIITICLQELIDSSSSSDSDDVLNNLIHVTNERKRCNKKIKFQHYVEKIVREYDSHEFKLHFRPFASNGIWCQTLIPIILVLYSLLYKVSNTYKFTAFLSLGYLVYSGLFVIFVSISPSVLQQSIYGGCIASSLISTLLVYIILSENIVISIIFTMPAVLMYSMSLRHILKTIPKTFTMGEAMVVMQGTLLFFLSAIFKFTVDSSKTEDDFVHVTVYAILSTVGLIVTVLYFMAQEQRNMRNLLILIWVACFNVLVILYCALGIGFAFKLLAFVFLHTLRVQIFVFWVCLVALAILLMIVKTRSGTKADTVTRKSFHILASLVFLSGILFDQDFMRFMAGVAFSLLILAEAVRKSNIEPFSSHLQSAFLVYSDEKDIGGYSLTPIYLFIGLACPLVVVPRHSGDNLELLAGVLSIGIGDTAASYFGSRYGTRKWSESNKTMEGTGANIMCQIIVVYVLHALGLLTTSNAIIKTVVAATVTGFVEAKTDQVDNLILPLISIITFQFLSFL